MGVGDGGGVGDGSSEAVGVGVGSTENCGPLQAEESANWSRESVLEQLARRESSVRVRVVLALSRWVWALVLVRVSALARGVALELVWEWWHG